MTEQVQAKNKAKATTNSKSVWGYEAWLDSIHEERLKQAEDGIVMEVTRLDTAGVSKKLELEVMPHDIRAHLQELMDEPDNYYAHDKELNWMADVLNVERATQRGPLSLWLDVSTPQEGVELSVGEDVYLSPPDFLAGLNKKIEDRLSGDTSLCQRDLNAHCEALINQSRQQASTLKLGRDPGGSAHYKTPPTFRPAQAAALASSKLPLSFIWGPPGTGKTFTLGHIVAQEVTRDPMARVLVLSIANLAVERVLLSADDAYQALKGEAPPEALLLRTQVPSLDEVKERYHLTAWSRLKAKHSETLEAFRQQLRSLMADHRRTQGAQRDEVIAQIAKVKGKRDAAKRVYRDERVRLIKEAGAVFSTLNQFAWSSDIYAESFDVVILEEASMIPMLYAMELFESFPKARFVIAGDPYQLSPVSELDEPSHPEWFQSVFSYFKLNNLNKAPVASKQTPNDTLSELTFLDTQNRMPHLLGDALSASFYHGRLKSAPTERNTPTPQGWPSGSLQWVDQARAVALAQESNLAERRGGGSNSCHHQARAAIKLAQEAQAAGASVYVITPFANQERLLKAYAQQARLKGIPCTTIHKAQGSEAEVVIFCTVNPSGWFMRESPSARELNVVAMSRAQSRLILLGDLREAQRNPLLKGVAERALAWP
jgi:hypothetical protein